MSTCKLVVLISGSGSNLQALIDAASDAPYAIVAVISNNAEAFGLERARRAAQNLPLTNFAICSAISHMGNMSALDASYAEAVVAGVVNTQPAARARLAAFADGSGPRIRG